MSELVPVRVPIQIRWRDLDPLGHVNNAVYLSYFELARIAYINALAPDAAIDPATWLPRDFSFILAEVQIRYRSPALRTDQLQITLYVSKIGRKSFIFEYRIDELVSGRLIAEGCSTQVWYDYSAGESRPVPEEMIRRIEEFQGATLERT